ncbi:MAG: hypothetical protein HGA76_04010, partial [Candidatus Firestonebacteria bacterium]|nr:hypothetical protein [Candidatus Firestonebacteria bacterium]
MSVVYEGKSVDLPAQLGSVEKAFQGQNKLIIHIQDLHCNYEVQKNIAGMIHLLAKEHGLKLVGEEGAFGTEDIDPIRSFPIAEIREAVGDYYVKQGRLTGAEYYGGTGEYPVKLEGIETPKLYEDSLAAVHGFLNAESQGYCLDLRESLDALKNDIYNPALLALDQERMAYRSGQLDVLGYAAKLKRLADEQGESLAAYPQLEQYLRQGTNLFGEKVEPDALFLQMDMLDEALREALYTSELQRELDAQYRRLDIVEKLLNISATQEELREFRTQREKFSVRSFSRFLQQQAGPEAVDPELYALDAYLGQVAEFYRLADIRSQHFAVNLTRKMEDAHENLAVVITGGFHSDGFLSELKKQGIGYLSIKPRLTKQDAANPYFSILQGKKLPIEKLLAKNQTILAPRVWPETSFFKEILGVNLGTLGQYLTLKFRPRLQPAVQAWLREQYRDDALKLVHLTPLQASRAAGFDFPVTPGCEVYVALTRGKSFPVLAAQDGLNFENHTELQTRLRVGGIGQEREYRLITAGTWKVLGEIATSAQRKPARIGGSILAGGRAAVATFLTWLAEAGFRLLKQASLQAWQTRMTAGWRQAQELLGKISLKQGIEPTSAWRALAGAITGAAVFLLVLAFFHDFSTAGTLTLATIFQLAAVLPGRPQSAPRFEEFLQQIFPAEFSGLDSAKPKDSEKYLQRRILCSLNSPEAYLDYSWNNSQPVPLGDYALILADKDPSGKLLVQECLPLIQGWLGQGHEQQAALALGKLALALAKFYPDASWYREIWEPLWKKVYAANPAWAAASLGEVAEALAGSDPTGRWLDTIWWPEYEKILRGDSEEGPKAAVQSLGGLARALAAMLKQGRLVQADEKLAKWLEKYDEVQGEDYRFLGQISEGLLGYLAMALAARDRTGRWFYEQWLPRYEENSTDKSLGGLAEAFGAMDNTGQWIKEVWLPLYETGKQKTPGNLIGLAKALGTLDLKRQVLLKGAGRQALLETVWTPRFKATFPKNGSEKLRFAKSLARDEGLSALMVLLWEADPSGALGVREIRPIYEMFFGDEDYQFSFIGAEAAGQLNSALRQIGKRDPDTVWLRQFWFPLYKIIGRTGNYDLKRTLEAGLVNLLSYSKPNVFEGSEARLARVKALEAMRIVPTPNLLDLGVSLKKISLAWEEVNRFWAGGYLFRGDSKRLL